MHTPILMQPNPTSESERKTWTSTHITLRYNARTRPCNSDHVITESGLVFKGGQSHCRFVLVEMQADLVVTIGDSKLFAMCHAWQANLHFITSSITVHVLSVFKAVANAAGPTRAKDRLAPNSLGNFYHFSQNIIDARHDNPGKNIVVCAAV